MVNAYDHRKIETYWQKRWTEERTYNVDIAKAKRPFYNLMMFPYPSAEGLHVGNVFAFTGADIFGRFKKAHGFDVFEPIGFDAFGIHSENHALKVDMHPWDLIPKNIRNFKENQLQRMGAMFDWAHEINTTDIGYYRWTQWIFLQLLKHGLAYRKDGLVNWCPSCQTVLSNEQVAEGVCERCDSKITKKKLKQWHLRITKYAQKLLDNLTWIDWSEKTKSAQRRWIGRSNGAEVVFNLDACQDELKVFTTRPDTLFGVTYIALAPEHPLIEKISTEEFRDDVAVYVEEALRKTAIERETAEREKTGVFTGCYALNPVNQQKIPIWVSDYVLMGYGTGAIMAVPAHDTRDFEFAKKFNLPIVEVISADGSLHEIEDAYTGEGTMVNSGQFDGMNSAEALLRITAWCAEQGFGRASVSYRLRDWGISRQRYWGPPVPVIHCEHCGIVPVPEQDLPIELPYVENFKPHGTGQSPLSMVPEFVQVKCPDCGANAQRDCDVMDNFLDSAWFFFRYLSANDDQQIFDADLVKKWMPVDMYIGGNEHAVLHLMYTRFLTMAFKDMGLIDFEEPFKKFRAHGLLIKEGIKMSKSKGNVINPDSYIEKYGADTLRSYLIFLGPYTDGGDFRDSGIIGIRRFLDKVWRLCTVDCIVDQPISDNAELHLMHKTIKKVTHDIEHLAYNTALSSLMVYVKGLQQWEIVKREALEILLKLLHPFAPHVAHELFKRLGNEILVADAGWPNWNEQYCQVEEIEFVFTVNGKPRGKSRQSVDITAEQAWAVANEIEAVTSFIANKDVVNKIFIPGKLLNIVVK